MPERQSIDEDLLFTALADPTRRRLLDRLYETQGQTLSEMIEGLNMRRQSATRHLKVLEAAHLVVVHWQGREKRHVLNPLPSARMQRRWIDKFSSARADALVSLREKLEEEK